MATFQVIRTPDVEIAAAATDVLGIQDSNELQPKLTHRACQAMSATATQTSAQGLAKQTHYTGLPNQRATAMQHFCSG
jgi:hypothetical protein